MSTIVNVNSYAVQLLVQLCPAQLFEKRHSLRSAGEVGLTVLVLVDLNYARCLHTIVPSGGTESPPPTIFAWLSSFGAADMSFEIVKFIKCA